MPTDREPPAARLVALHDRVNQKADALYQHHGARLLCKRGCHDCCVDELTVFAVEADRIRDWAGDQLRGAAPAAPGRCAFLDGEGACRIYPARPYVCRTQGLPLRWMVEEDWEWVEYRDICPLNEAGPPLETLEEDACWTIGEVEGELAALQAERTLADQRIALRDLFAELAAHNTEGER
ncbi:YkgJ family cysteine cluster protein [Acanthopleuribacter pedis]|uniref:YkgJ family cysteine cluster protein n=1 Tax=Acanthopleuribacter pedis TaxID=442870 RepID=A0A8J7Q8B9_9BACT|nr:YkgJ family cysteine cluster protein [Acanthopleuribacter pedis]MBO1320311.1 YkgJ family cysteine cluster protein [Acanthopleuribacter pedis]